MQFIQDQSDFKFIDLCVQSLREIAQYKTTLKGMLERDGNEEGALMKTFMKCLEITDGWSKDVSSVLIPRTSTTNAQGGLIELNFSEVNIMEKLIEEEEDKKKSVLFASKAMLIRSNAFFILARCIKAGYPLTSTETDCHLVNRILGDLSKSKDNWILFESIVELLSAMEVDPAFTMKMLLDHYVLIFRLLHEYPN